jgi:hypothetical protein
MTKIVIRNRVATAVLSVCLIAVPAWGAGKASDVPTDPTKLSLRDLVKALAKKARSVRKIGKTEPSVDSKLAFKYMQVKDKNTQLFRLLSTRRLDPDSSIDGYIKRTLLTLQPDFFKAKPSQHMAVLGGLPAYLPMIEPTKAQVKSLSRASGPIRKESALYKQIKMEVERLLKHRQMIRDRNEHTSKYRLAIEQRMPSKGGIKLYAIVTNIRDRMATNNWVEHQNPRVDAMMGEAKTLWDGRKSIVLRKSIKAVADDIRSRQRGGKKYYQGRRVIIFKADEGKVELQHWHHDPLGGSRYNELMTFLGYKK